jgi:uncharacterized protein YecE (DUF72 family)
MAEIRIGTSGYSFKDWKGTFYPPGISNSDMLEFYTQYFDCVEINSTYYRILSQFVFRSMGERAPEGFDFLVKLHRSMTHDRASLHETIDQFRTSIEPLEEVGKLKGLLAQFPWSFRNSKESREHVLLLRSQLEDYLLFVEFRNSSWATPGILSFLRNHGLLYCSVDEPDLPGLMPPVAEVTGDTGYVRFHGRNRKAWWGGSTDERYNYSYNREELEPWVKKIKIIGNRVKKIYLFFNNCHAGHAARNALLMKKLFGFHSKGEQVELFDNGEMV